MEHSDRYYSSNRTAPELPPHPTRRPYVASFGRGTCTVTPRQHTNRNRLTEETQA